MIEIAAIVMAAGRGRRFGAGEADSKVLAPYRDLPLINHVVMAAQASRAVPVIVVTGHAGVSVSMALAGFGVTLVHNQHHADGMAGSLKVGLAALPQNSAGALILLGDMPLVTSATLDALIAAFEARGADAIIPTMEGRRGNPVLIGRALFSALALLKGDEGARQILKQADAVRECPVGDPGILVDVDTPDALQDLPGLR